MNLDRCQTGRLTDGSGPPGTEDQILIDRSRQSGSGSSAGSEWSTGARGVVSLRRSRLESAAVEVAVLFRTPEGRYVHRRVRCIGSDLKSGLGHLFDPNPETLAHAGEPSCPRAVEDHSFEYADQALAGPCPATALWASGAIRTLVPDGVADL